MCEVELVAAVLAVGDGDVVAAVGVGPVGLTGIGLGGLLSAHLRLRVPRAIIPGAGTEGSEPSQQHYQNCAHQAEDCGPKHREHPLQQSHFGLERGNIFAQLNDLPPDA